MNLDDRLTAVVLHGSVNENAARHQYIPLKPVMETPDATTWDLIERIAELESAYDILEGLRLQEAEESADRIRISEGQTKKFAVISVASQVECRRCLDAALKCARRAALADELAGVLEGLMAEGDVQPALDMLARYKATKEVPDELK